ncbi:hypothetical protein [Lelliottia amnigena]|uniref:hypothetical protein n=1 Tax=Lelliottia amnigena TaxID=61646 RepID=UPI0013F17E83|nr:hypothetical protein [Lelliottia amnigena]
MAEILAAFTAIIIGFTGAAVLALRSIPMTDSAYPIGCTIVNMTSIVLAVGLEAAL